MLVSRHVRLVKLRTVPTVSSFGDAIRHTLTRVTCRDIPYSQEVISLEKDPRAERSLLLIRARLTQHPLLITTFRLNRVATTNCLMQSASHSKMALCPTLLPEFPKKRSMKSPAS